MRRSLTIFLSSDGFAFDQTQAEATRNKYSLRQIVKIGETNAIDGREDEAWAESLSYTHKTEGFVERARNEMETTKPVTVQACGVCEQTVQTGDLFCRKCGTIQQDLPNSPTAGFGPLPEARAESQSLRPPVIYETGPLPAAAAVAPNIYHPVSGRLVSSLVTSLGVTPAAQLCSPLMKKVIVALSLLPIWAIIIFLSPLDAYLAAVSVTAENGCGPTDVGRSFTHPDATAP